MSKKQVWDGRIVDLANLRPEDVHLSDIINALPKINRFSGMTTRPYSVAEHSLRLAYYFMTGDEHLFAYLALMHDAHEVYCGDITTPVKRLSPEVDMHEKRIALAVREKFRMPRVMPPEIKTADTAIMNTEVQVLMQAPEEEWRTDDMIPWENDVTILRPFDVKTYGREPDWRHWRAAFRSAHETLFPFWAAKGWRE